MSPNEEEYEPAVSVPPPEEDLSVSHSDSRMAFNPSNKVTTREFLHGRVVWGRGVKADYVFYMKNEHNILALCCSHPNHPYGKCSRALIVLSSLAFSFMLTGWLALTIGCNQCPANSCVACFHDYDVTFHVNSTLPPYDYEYLLASTRYWVRGACSWCGKPKFAGGCYPSQQRTFRPLSFSCPSELNIGGEDGLVNGLCAIVDPPPADSSAAESAYVNCQSSVRMYTFLGALITGALALLHERLLQRVGYCRCAYKSATKERRHKVAFYCCKTIGATVLFVCTLFGLVYGVTGWLFMAAAQKDWTVALEGFFLNKLFSWLLAVPLLTMIFFLKRWWQLRKGYYKDGDGSESFALTEKQKMSAPLLADFDDPLQVRDQDDDDDDDNDDPRSTSRSALQSRASAASSVHEQAPTAQQVQAARIRQMSDSEQVGAAGVVVNMHQATPSASIFSLRQQSRPDSAALQPRHVSVQPPAAATSSSSAAATAAATVREPSQTSQTFSHVLASVLSAGPDAPTPVSTASVLVTGDDVPTVTTASPAARETDAT